MKHILNILATWRLMILIKEEDAPFDILKRFRESIEHNLIYGDRYFSKVPHSRLWELEGRILNEIYEALQCDWCLSIWCGLFVAIATRQNIVYALAYSAGALFLKPVFDAFISGDFVFNLNSMVYEMSKRQPNGKS